MLHPRRSNCSCVIRNKQFVEHHTVLTTVARCRLHAETFAIIAMAYVLSVLSGVHPRIQLVRLIAQ
jgi:hypothetical protein